MDSDKPGNELQVREGVMDLSAWHYDSDKVIKLDGEWEFYWNQLLTPASFEFPGDARLSPNAYMKVPSSWNGVVVDGRPLPVKGAATYRAVLKNVPISGVLALKKNNIRFSSVIYVNGEKLLEDGRPSLEADSYTSGNVPGLGLFDSRSDEVEIIIQVANYDYINSGIPISLYFGDHETLLQDQQQSRTQEFSATVILGTLAVIYFVCFVAAAFYRKMDYSLLVFSIVCLLYAVYNGFIGERPLLLYLPEISFETMYKLKDISSIASFIGLSLFFYQLKRGLISLRALGVIVAVLGTGLLLLAIVPNTAYVWIQTFLIVFYQLLIIWLLVRVAKLYLNSVRVERLKSFLLFMAILCINLYSLNLILFASASPINLWVGQVYLLLLNLTIMLLVVLRFFEAYQTIDEMKNKLLEMDKIKDDFLSNTSHELKTPLNAIVNITESLLKGAEGKLSDRQAHNLAIVTGSGRRLTHLVGELLDYSKMKHGNIALYRSSLDLKSAVDSVIRVHLFLLDGKPITLLNLIGDKMPAVYADSNRLLQILHNLIGNAIKFTDQGRIEISARAIHDRAEVRIRDTGIGVPAHLHETIFQSFEQAETGPSRNRGGTGLGLSITKRLVELQGGTIHVTSRPGDGSVFTFTLPLSGKAPKPVGEWINTNAPSLGQAVLPYTSYPVFIEGSKKEPILIVDDDYANLQSMINLFKLEDYSIVVVNRGQLALNALAEQSNFFLIILDIMMPDMSGYEVLAKVRERFSPFELPVLMLTAKNREVDIKLSLEQGANDVVGKPFEAEELLARVRSLMRLKASVKQAKDAEIDFLRSQIKPHFLYNALNSIAELCVVEPQQAEELTIQLSKYLRSSFDFEHLDYLSTIKDELELVQAYVSIEKARFGARLQVEYEVDADLHIRIPQLVLQPLVENAIRHGLMSNLHGGKVVIAIKQRNAVVSFVVEDNGCGMNESKRSSLLLPGREKKGVGLWNISQRIMLLYGRGVDIQSAEGQGTRVSFDIAVQQLKQTGG
jgi:signal transduction histidine kinase